MLLLCVYVYAHTQNHHSISYVLLICWLCPGGRRLDKDSPPEVRASLWTGNSQEGRKSIAHNSVLFLIERVYMLHCLYWACISIMVLLIIFIQ